MLFLKKNTILVDVLDIIQFAKNCMIIWILVYFLYSPDKSQLD